MRDATYSFYGETKSNVPVMPSAVPVDVKNWSYLGC